MKLYRAKWLLPLVSPPLEDGAFLVDRGVVVALGKYQEVAEKSPAGALQYDLGASLVAPGLINIHTHLDYSFLRGKISSELAQKSFAAWIRAVTQAKQSCFPQLQEEMVEAYQAARRELEEEGCTTIVNIVTFPELVSSITTDPGKASQLWHLMELIDVGQKEVREQQLRQLFAFSEGKEWEPWQIGVSPHAPQTASLELYRAAQEVALRKRLLFSTHLLESIEEVQLFLEREGPFFEFFTKMGRDMSDCRGISPLELLLQEKLLPPGALLIHMNQLTSRDRELIKRYHDCFFIVHCPKTHAYFGREKWDYQFWKKAGFTICLGTDSLASNDSLNLRAEMREAGRQFPELPPEELLRMVTLYPAQALKRVAPPESVGGLMPGARADVMIFPCEELLTSERSLAEYLIYTDQKPTLLRNFLQK